MLNVKRVLSSSEKPAVLEEQVVGTLCAVAESVLKNGQQSIEDSVVKLAREIVLEGSTHPSPEFDPKYHEKFDMPGWGSPLPRIEAAQGLIHLLSNWLPDPEVVSTVEKLSKDLVPAVRYQIASGLVGLYVKKMPDEFWRLTTEMFETEKTTGVMLGLLHTLRSVAGVEPERVVNLLSQLMNRGLPNSDRHEFSQSLLNIIAGLFVFKGDPNADALLRRFESDPIRFHSQLSDEALTASSYLSNRTDAAIRQRAISVIRRVIVATYASLKESPTIVNELLRLLDTITFRLYLALEVNPQVRGDQPEIDSDGRRSMYVQVKPLLALLSTRLDVPGDHYLAPDTAHHLMETFNSVLSFDPEDVVTYAAAVCRASAKLSYQYDALAVGEMVKLVERMLADHKEVLRRPEAARAIGEMLDIFVRAGWPQAIQLTFKLDRAIR
jgi:limonene-1,2-epoxide hydrolase